jgi:cysteine-rich repeat protein
MALATGAPGIAIASPQSCRLAIAQSMSKVVKVGYKDTAGCQSHKDKAPGAATGACRDVTSTDFDPKGRYTSTKTKAGPLITAACSGQTAVLANYDGNDPATTVGGVVDDTVSGNTLLVLGNNNLGGDKKKAKCVETISKYQGRIIKLILKDSTKCQSALDANGQPFGALAATCVDNGSLATGSAFAGISVACNGLTGGDVGTCSPLPDCAIDNTVTAGQTLAKAFYKSITPPPPVCGNSVVEGTEQCDDGANNGTLGDPCSATCVSLAETCGPGTPAGGTITGHRIVKVALDIPGGQKLAGVQVGFDYPQLEASIPGTGSSDVVHNTVTLLQPAPGSGFLDLAKDTDSEFSYLLASGTEFISSGDLFQVSLDQCVSLSENICSRSQNVIHCCPNTDIVACNAAPDDQVACFCGALGVVNKTDCAAVHDADFPSGCTEGVCANFPNAPAGSCDTGTLTCTTTGRACALATEASDCATWAAPVGSCDTASKTCKSTAPNPGKACTAANESLACSGSLVDEATCTTNHACSRLGDQTNGTYGCTSIFNPLGAKIGQFPAVAVGPAMAVQFGFSTEGACPTNNTCADQAQLTEASCHVTDPVDGLAQPVSGVTCTITVTEAP